jgi:hypothetical protein
MISPAGTQEIAGKVVRCARLHNMRALAWDGNTLYASRGYKLLRASIDEFSAPKWQEVGEFGARWIRRLSVSNRLTARLLRDGLHALAVLPSGGSVAALPGVIGTLAPGESQFRETFRIRRGTRPLHITAVPRGSIYWGEYFDNASRQEVHVYASGDAGLTWDVAYTFPKGAIRHVHNIVHDPWQNCLWILTGDYGDECRVIRASCDFSNLEIVLQGNQQVRAVAAIACEDALYFASDTPLEQNSIWRLDHQRLLSRVAAISSSCISAARVGSHMFFSTMVEPSEVNLEPMVRVYAGDMRYPERWHPLLNWRKDRWPMKFFQYGNALLPDGQNTTRYLAVTTIAVEADDMVTSIYDMNPDPSSAV